VVLDQSFEQLLSHFRFAAPRAEVRPLFELAAP
jgi:hypothetical protein